ncbi:MAG: TIGR02147 family protein [Bdellovibrio sp.]
MDSQKLSSKNLKLESETVQILMKAFLRLKDENRNISIRSVAKRSMISAPYLSKILRGEKKVPLKLIQKISKALHMDFVEINNLQRLVLEELEEKKVGRKTGMKVVNANSVNFREYKTMTRRDYFLFEKWFYIPILNLVTLSGFNSDPSWIGQKLGISEREAQFAIGDLISHGYLMKNEGKELKRTDLKLRFPTDQSHVAIRNYHKMMIEKAENTLEKTDQKEFENRLINCISFAGNSQKLKQAQVIINEALYKAAELLANDTLIDSVYQVNLQFFEITKKS